MAKKEKSITTLEIINGISQVIANTHDGAVDDEGNPIEIGLDREKGHPINDSRIVDGFSAGIHADKLIVCYQSDVLMRNLHKNGFEDDIEAKLADIVKFIKKQYKAKTGKTLSLKKDGESVIDVQTTKEKDERLGREGKQNLKTKKQQSWKR
jgi:hypothetical protein